MRPESEVSPDSPKPFKPQARIASFGHAFRGIAEMIRTEHNARIHLLATGVVLFFGFGLGIRPGEWLAVILAMTFVWTAEAINTAIETLCDLVSPEIDPRVKKAKDVAAGAVLVSAMGALVVGLIVFVPRLLGLATS